MQTNSQPEWFAIQTRPGAEDIATQTMATLGLETFLPRARIPLPRRCRQPAAMHRVRPLFPSYCFARFVPEAHLHAVRYSRGVLRVLGGAATPCPVATDIIEGIRVNLDRDGVADFERPRFRAGDRVRICRGPFEGLTGIFDNAMDDRMRVVILLQAIQQARVVLDSDCLERAESV